MLKITGLTKDSLQELTLVLPDGEGQVVFTIYFVSQQYGWFITKLTYNDFVLQGLRITTGVNILHQFKNIIPFGLACLSKENREPSLIEDFFSEASVLYILSKAETEEYTGIITSG